MSSKRSNKKQESQSSSQPKAKSSELWKNLSEEKEEQTNGGCYPCYGYRSSYYYYY